jgi:predicted TIM-barrel fold metal-dependent hydrolase
VDKVIIVSADGHAVMEPERWPKYLEQEYHEHIPALTHELDVFTKSMTLLNDLTLSEEACEVFDDERAYRSGQWRGLWDADVRLAEMDREGVAAEFVFQGDFRAPDLGYNTMNGTYPFDMVDAGVRAYDRWLVDNFGGHSDRFLLVGPSGTYSDMDAALQEAAWVAEHGFVGTFAPGFCHFGGIPPFYDDRWEPLWSLYEDAGMTLVIHGGFGFDQGFAYDAVEAANAKVQAEGGGIMELAAALAASVFNSDFFSDLRCRRAMWQLLLGGVFDRHPGLKLMMTEVRADWIPALLGRLDDVFEEHRATLPATRRPSEYWSTNCMAGLSFMHAAEVEMRHEIGVDTIDFGRDYPHTEGTWPNTLDYLSGLFAGVPEDDVRLMLGENAIRFLHLDRARLADIAARVGPTIDEITGGAEVDAALLAHLDDRCGFAKPAEGASRVREVDDMLRDDLAAIGARAGV